MQLYYSNNLNPRVAVAVAQHLESPVEYIFVSPRHPDHEEAFRSINPNTLVPVLVEANRTLWETDAIACRLSAVAGSDFWRTDEHLPDMVMWISWASSHLNSAAGTLYFYNVVVPKMTPASDRGASIPLPNPAVLEEALRDFRHFAAILDGKLEDRRWLLGEALSYADFRVATALPFAQGAGLPVSDFPNVKRWHDQLWALDAWRAPFEHLA
jgi:glutathione S-transferase